MWSTLVMLLVIVLAGWAVASVLRAPRPPNDPQVDWEHWLEASGLRPVLPRTRPVAAAVEALGRHPAEVARAAMGHADDGAVLVVAQMVDTTVLVAARRTGPAPTGEATAIMQGWQARLTSDGPARAWQDAAWLRTGTTLAR